MTRTTLLPFAFAVGVLLGTFTSSCFTSHEVELPACRLDWSKQPPCTVEGDETTCAYICTVRLHGRRIAEI